MSKLFSRLFVVFISLFTSLQLNISRAETFLPPDQAFAFTAVMRDANNIQVNYNVAPNYYMYRDDFSVTIVSPDGQVEQNGAIKLPAGVTKFDENFNKNVQIFHGNVTFNVPIKGSGLFKLVVSSRGCADGGLCYPPRKSQAVLTAVPKGLSNAQDAKATKGDVEPSKSKTNELSVATAETKNPPTLSSNQTLSMPAQTTIGELPKVEKTTSNVDSLASNDNSDYAKTIFSTHNIPVALMLIFGLGVLLSLTPCMLPMLPILSTVLAGQEQVSRKRGFALALAYVTGMAIVYAIIGLIAAKTGAGLHKYLQSPMVLGVFAILLCVLALSLFDVFHIHIPQKIQLWLTNKTHGKGGMLGVGLMGAASAIIASPCVTAPLVGVITYIAQTGNTVLGGLALFVLAYGMGLPLLLLGAGMGQFLPKSGAWMVHIKRLIGVIMLAAALWIAQPIWGKYWQNALGSKQGNVTFQSIKSVAALEEVIAKSDKPIFLDLYADWCRSCIEMEKNTFPDSRVKERLSTMNLVRVDMTSFTEDDAALLKRFGLYGPPAMIVLEPVSGKEKMRVIGYEDADQFAKSLDSLK